MKRPPSSEQRNEHIGSSLDEVLEADGTLAEAEKIARERLATLSLQTPIKLEDWEFFVLAFSPMPKQARDEFDLAAGAISDGYSVEKPVVTSQRTVNGGQAFTLNFRLAPTGKPAGPMSAQARTLKRMLASVLSLPTEEGIPMSATSSINPEDAAPKPEQPEGVRTDPDGWPSDPKEFGQAVRHARNAVPITQATLAKRVGCTEVTIRNIENGGKPIEPHRKALVSVFTQLGQRYKPAPISANSPSTNNEEAP